MEKAGAAEPQFKARNIQFKHENPIKLSDDEQKRNLDQLKLSEERFATIFHESPIMMSIRTQNGNKFVDVNSKWEQLTGYSRQEAIGSSLYDLNLLVNSAQWSEAIRKVNNNRDAELAIRTKSGEILDLIMSQQVINLNSEDCWLTVSLDITERKQLEQEMARLDRLNLIGEMAASIGHEIRNPMTSVRGFLQMFEVKYSEDKEFLGLMIEELDRANAIITEFLSLAKNKVVELAPQKLNSIVYNILPLVKASAIIQDKNVNVEIKKIPDLMLDKKEIRQLILNLVHNGLEAMEAGGTITIRTFTQGDYVVLSIQDQGTGIEPEVLERLGTPFFTTKEKGTGLGLAVCYGIASRHRASINIDTGDQGTTVSVRFPLL